MNTRILKDMIALIRVEQERRSLSLKDQDYAYDHWIFWDEPFINELCLMFLVTLRHQVEREIIGLAARAADNGKEINSQQYTDRIKQLKIIGKNTHESWKWTEIINRLEQKFCENYKYMEILRLLSNSYKHDFSAKPTEELLKELRPKSKLNYASLPESDSLRKLLANFIGLGDEAGYCDIAERFVDIANDFLAEVKSRTVLSKVKSSGVSLKPSDFEG